MPDIDLRSDTVTTPTPAMRQAMATAAVGEDAANLVTALGAAGVRVNAIGPRRVRLVTHKDVAAADIAEALERMATVLRSGRPGGTRAPVYG